MKVIVLFSRGKAWVEGQPYWKQGLEPHKKYLVEHFTDALISAGPFTDHRGGLVIVEMESVEEVEEILNYDPAVLEGKFTYTVHPWKPVEGLFC